MKPNVLFIDSNGQAIINLINPAKWHDDTAYTHVVTDNLPPLDFLFKSGLINDHTEGVITSQVEHVAVSYRRMEMEFDIIVINEHPFVVEESDGAAIEFWNALLAATMIATKPDTKTIVMTGREFDPLLLDRAPDKVFLTKDAAAAMAIISG